MIYHCMLPCDRRGGVVIETVAELNLIILVFDEFSIIYRLVTFFFFFSSRRRHTRCSRDWSSDVCSSDLVATCVPRRNTTLVLDNPHARPIGSKTTTGFDTSRATPCRSGPGQRCRSSHALSHQRSIRSESAAITARLRVPCMTAALRATAIAPITSWAAASN